MRTNTFDTAGFYAAIDAVRQARGVSWYVVFQRTGVITVRSAKERKSTPDRDNRTRLAAWAGIDASAFERKVGQA